MKQLEAEKLIKIVEIILKNNVFLSIFFLKENTNNLTLSY